LIDELRNIGVYKPLHQLRVKDFSLTATNELGEHFIKLLAPKDTLQSVAITTRELTVLADDLRQALEALIRKDEFRDLDHTNDYLRYGAAALVNITAADDEDCDETQEQCSGTQDFGEMTMWA
jgi:hypothetical protein